jgi:uncharacterized cupin superfamily protein
MFETKDPRALALLAADRAGMEEDVVRHPLNRNAELHGISLSRKVGLERLGLNLVRVPPGRDSFALHAHAFEEEFVFVLAGRGIVRADDAKFEIARGDFVGFPAGGPAHLLHNPYDEDLVYLAGGERREFDVIDFPQAGRRLVRIGGESTLYPAQSGEPLFGRGGRETVTAEP